MEKWLQKLKYQTKNFDLVARDFSCLELIKSGIHGLKVLPFRDDGNDSKRDQMLKFDCNWQLQHFVKQRVVHYSMGNTFRNGDACSARNCDLDNRSVRQPAEIIIFNFSNKGL